MLSSSKTGVEEERAIRPRASLRFSFRALFIGLAFLAILLGWYTSSESSRRVSQQLARRLSHAELEMDRARWFDRSAAAPRPPLAKGVLSGAKLDAVTLEGATVTGGDSAFQRTDFGGSNLANATLTGKVSAFQAARFDNARLANATLTGGGASFQYATFIQADLTGATISGGASALQRATFQDACLVDAVIRCSGAAFQMVNIDGTQFEGADLSALDSSSLASCHFKNPPTYDSRTKFPIGFSPVEQLWKRTQ